MRVIFRGRGQGKTTELIRACAANDKYGLIVCASMPECARVFQVAQDMGLDIPLPITYEQFIKQRYAGRRIDCFYIDNADLLLQSLSRGVVIEAVSITGSEDVVQKTEDT